MTTSQVDSLILQARDKMTAGQFPEAQKLAEEANRIDPGNPNPYRVLGQISRARGDFKKSEEIFQFLKGHFPGEADIVGELAVTKWAAGEKDEGYDLAKKAKEMDDSSPFVLEALADMASQNAYWPVVIDAYEKLSEQFPDTIRFHGLKAEALQNSQRYEEAAKAFAPFIRIQGENAANLFQMGMFLFQARLFEEAVPWFEKASKMDPENDEPVFYLARCHIQFGDLEKGEVLANKALELTPDSIQALTLLNELRPSVITEVHIERLFAKLEKGVFVGPLEKAMIHLFLGKYFHKAKRYDDAFAQFKEANDERFRVFSKEGIIYEKKLMEENFAETRRIFVPERMKKMAGGGSDSTLPIMIVSMPRSGTTLLEQIISSHSRVFGAGEVTTMSRIFFDLNYKINLDLNKPIEEVIKENAKEWAELYLKELRAPEGVLRATDKLPVNFIHLGLFQAMFPNARAIYIRRHPLDTCLSMYSNNLSHGYAYSAKQDTLGHYFNLHAGLMRHWKENLAMKYLQVDYPDLVENTEEKAREILDFCGLEWEDRVLEFYKGRKSSFTISQVQVSHPINKKGLGRWVPYKKYIGPLIEALDEDIVGPLGVEDV